jgi:RNA polymerase sigma factor (sigma-70 family)
VRFLDKHLRDSEKKTYVADIERRHGERLRRFLASRLRDRAVDANDLAQEVFLRMLRIEHLETIRSPESYLFMVAFHVLHQHVMRRAAIPESVEITALIDQIESGPETDPSHRAELDQRIARLHRAIEQLPPNAQAVLLLHRRDGWTLEAIAEKLGFSRANAAKYLAKALLHCRLQLGASEP